MDWPIDVDLETLRAMSLLSTSVSWDLHRDDTRDLLLSVQDPADSSVAAAPFVTEPLTEVSAQRAHRVEITKHFLQDDLRPHASYCDMTGVTSTVLPAEEASGLRCLHGIRGRDLRSWPMEVVNGALSGVAPWQLWPSTVYCVFETQPTMQTPPHGLRLLPNAYEATRRRNAPDPTHTYGTGDQVMPIAFSPPDSSPPHAIPSAPLGLSIVRQRTYGARNQVIHLRPPIVFETEGEDGQRIPGISIAVALRAGSSPTGSKKIKTLADPDDRPFEIQGVDGTVMVKEKVTYRCEVRGDKVLSRLNLTSVLPD